MTNAKWHSHFLRIAEANASISKDPSTKVGAVITDSLNRVISLGYNGYARGVSDVYEDRDEKLRRTIHAEVNAIIFSQRDLTGCSIYTTHPPCANCTSVIIQSGIAQVVSVVPLDDFSDRWLSSMLSSQKQLTEAGYSLITETIDGRHIQIWKK